MPVSATAACEAAVVFIPISKAATIVTFAVVAGGLLPSTLMIRTAQEEEEEEEQMVHWVFHC